MRLTVRGSAKPVESKSLKTGFLARSATTGCGYSTNDCTTSRDYRSPFWSGLLIPPALAAHRGYPPVPPNRRRYIAIAMYSAQTGETTEHKLSRSGQGVAALIRDYLIKNATDDVGGEHKNRAPSYINGRDSGATARGNFYGQRKVPISSAAITKP